MLHLVSDDISTPKATRHFLLGQPDALDATHTFLYPSGVSKGKK